MTHKNILVFYSNTNTGKKKDATGAFIPEAKAFAKIHKIPKENMIGVKCPHVARVKRRKIVLQAIESFPGRLDAIAFFGHG